MMTLLLYFARLSVKRTKYLIPPLKDEIRYNIIYLLLGRESTIEMAIIGFDYAAAVLCEILDRAHTVVFYVPNVNRRDRLADVRYYEGRFQLGVRRAGAVHPDVSPGTHCGAGGRPV